MKKTLLFLIALLSFLPSFAREVSYSVISPDGKNKVVITAGTELYFTAYHNGRHVTASSIISMAATGSCIGQGAKVLKTSDNHVERTVETPLYKASSVKECYNEKTIWFKGGFGLIFRVYDEGFAYRFFNTSLKAGDKVYDESLSLRFDKDYTCYMPFSKNEKNPFQTSFENQYSLASISSQDSSRLAFTPVMVNLEDGLRLLVTESDLQSYPGMFLKRNAEESLPSLTSSFARIPDKVTSEPVRCAEIVDSYSDAMAVIEADASKVSPVLFPWRVFIVSENDTDLLSSNLVYLLAEKSRIADVSWVKPGKIAWDWWNNWGISGVDFKAGINTDTYKYYIDFASAHGIEYVVLDEGWSPSADGDIMKIIPQIDLNELCRYASEKNVGLILWAVAYTLDKKLEEACAFYSAMGIKGFKVDFIDRDDASAVKMNWRIAQTAAKYNMIVDFHGMYKPAGFNRTWPNVVNFEGIWGLENMKWSDDDMVCFDVTFPYIRMVSGPLDYTQGAVRNKLKDEYVHCWSNPSSQGTRARQVAEYVVFDSPFVMLCDNPSAYMKEEETVSFITAIPTVWDKTVGLMGEIGKYIVTARKGGGKWYIGGMTDWSERDVTLDLEFIGKPKVNVVLFRDGINVDRTATDYKIETLTVDTSKPLTIHMAPGGGFALCAE